MEKINLELTYIDFSKTSLDFLEKRLRLDKYRGIQISQHNRYNLGHVLTALKLLYNKFGTEKMQIRTEDISKRQHNLPNEKKYAEYVNELNKSLGKFTQDSVRKNLFVDLNRMGLINRYNNDELVLPYTKRIITSISISDFGIELINDNLNILERQMKYSECIDKLLKGFAIKLIKILSKLGKISLLEFILFVSFVDKNIDDKLFLEEDIIELVEDFRRLSKAQQQLVESKIKKYADPKNFKGNKTDKKDFNNWKNEAQQIFNLLNQTALYEYDKKNKMLYFKTDKENSIFKKDDIKKLKRSSKAKEKYFEQHSVSKKKGYELHHIVPLLKAKNSEHFFLLDVWENLLYIDGKTHAIISQNGNKQIVLEILENNHIILTDLETPLFIKFNENVFYNTNNKEIMLDKNRKLIKTL